MVAIPWNELKLINPVETLSFPPNRYSAWFNARDRDNYNPGYRDPGDPEGHGGLDLHDMRAGRALAPVNGLVVWASWGNSGSGYVICITVKVSGGWFLIRMLHLKEGSLLVKVGDQVKAGDWVANVGSTGASTYPHVHLEVRFLTKPFDPKIDSVNQGIKLDPLAFGVLSGVESLYYGHLIPPPGPVPAVIPAVMKLGFKGPAVLLWRGVVVANGYGGKVSLWHSVFTKTLDRKTRRLQRDTSSFVADGVVDEELWAAALGRLGL